MTYQRNLIVFPVLNTLLKQLLDRQWHNKAFVKNTWRQSIPPEYFERRKHMVKAYWRDDRHRMESCKRSTDGIISRTFRLLIRSCALRGYLELRMIGESYHDPNYDIRITDKGILRYNNGETGSHFVTHNGETRSIASWCKKLNLSHHKFRFWICTKKVPFEEAVANSGKTGRVRCSVRSRMITHNGETKSFTEWCRQYKVGRSRMHHYLRSMTFEGALEKCLTTPPKQVRQPKRSHAKMDPGTV